jgi:periplasmic divalent cation tolerance protein
LKVRLAFGILNPEAQKAEDRPKQWRLAQVSANDKGLVAAKLNDAPENDRPVLVYATFPSANSAANAGDWLVENGLAACVNIVPGMTSIYRWKGEIHRDAEVMALIKTRASLAERVVSGVRERHPYENPALVVIEMSGGSADFLGWIMACTQKGR